MSSPLFTKRISGRYRAPEFRAPTVLRIDPAALADPAAVLSDQVRSVYEQEGEARFGAPAREVSAHSVFPPKQVSKRIRIAT